MHKTILTAAALMLSVNSALAIEDMQTDDGIIYEQTLNKHGAVLRAKGHPTLYVGKDCDAASSDGLKGSWSWANAGSGINVGAKVYWFPGQVPEVGNNKANCIE